VLDGEHIRAFFQVNLFEAMEIDLYHLFFISGTALSPSF